MVDALACASPGPTIVVRSNGGAQAGHTVCLADGRRHVFHHFAAGALAGAATHLSRFFVNHPMLFAREREALIALGARVDASVDPRSFVTTPWDMLINQAAERARGEARHGSCGLGFGETIERCMRDEFRLTAGELGRGDLRRRCESIRDVWAPRRLAALGVALTPEEAGIVADDCILEAYLEDCAHFADLTRLRSDAALRSLGAVIFEAQGLMLDQAIGTMPHVTRSHTGLANMAAIAAEAGIEEIEAIYVTRAYATRHGAGPLPGGADGLEGFEIVDETNAPNAWQGKMRYAALDLDVIDGGGGWGGFWFGGGEWGEDSAGGGGYLSGSGAGEGGGEGCRGRDSPGGERCCDGGWAVAGAAFDRGSVGSDAAATRHDGRDVHGGVRADRLTMAL